jgi:tripartite motif-containing protein 71
VDGWGDVYVVDSGNCRIQKFTSSGDYLQQWGSNGTENGKFDQPTGVAVGPGNVVYVADSANQRIQKFTSNGDYLGQWGSRTDWDYFLSWPQELTVDRQGNVYVACRFGNCIKKFTASGTHIATYISPNLPFEPRGVAVDSRGNIYVSDFNSRVLSYYPPGNIVPILDWLLLQ